MSEKEKVTPSQIGKYHSPEHSCIFNFRGFRNVNKLLKYITYLLKVHDIEVKIINFNLEYPYVSFEVEGVRDIALINVFIQSIADSIKDQDIYVLCSCKGHIYWWDMYQKDKNTLYFRSNENAEIATY